MRRNHIRTGIFVAVVLAILTVAFSQQDRLLRAILPKPVLPAIGDIDVSAYKAPGMPPQDKYLVGTALHALAAEWITDAFQRSHRSIGKPHGHLILYTPRIQFYLREKEIYLIVTDPIGDSYELKTTRLPQDDEFVRRLLSALKSQNQSGPVSNP